MSTFIAIMVHAIMSSTLCCHQHADGTVGCWPNTTASVACDPGEGMWVKPCPDGYYQGDRTDEESWSCKGTPNA
jgi:hypothetical protein